MRTLPSRRRGQNVAGLLLVVIFMYAVLGVTLFTFVVHQSNLNNQRNFDTLGSAFLVLFQVRPNGPGGWGVACFGGKAVRCVFLGGTCGVACFGAFVFCARVAVHGRPCFGDTMPRSPLTTHCC